MAWFGSRTVRKSLPIDAAHYDTTRRPIFRFISFAKPYAFLVGLAAFGGTFKFLIPLLMPLLVQIIIDHIVGSIPIPPLLDSYFSFFYNILPSLDPSPAYNLLILCFTTIFVFILMGGAIFMRTYFANIVGNKMIFNLRYALFQHLQKMSLTFYKEIQAGAIVSRVINDIQVARQMIGGAVIATVMDIITLVVVVIIVLSINWQLSLIAFIVLPLYILTFKKFNPVVRKSSKLVQENIQEISGNLHEKITGVEIIQSFTRELHEKVSFIGELKELMGNQIRLGKFNGLIQAISATLVNIGAVMVLLFGGFFVLNDYLTAGQLVAFSGYIGALYFPLSRLSELNIIVQNSSAAIERIYEFFDLFPDVKETPKANPLSRIAGEIRYDHVTFGYKNDQPILHDLTFTIEPGKTVALVGPSGGGKSSIVRLLPRFYDPQHGAILIDGNNVADLKLKDLRRHIGIVPQDPMLFSGSIIENIWYGDPNASIKQIKQAAKAAFAHDFIKSLPGEYDTLVGERGVFLSGGQKQRIALARAILKDPKILILDEATSSLDAESENYIQQAMLQILPGRTTLVIAHRLSTVVNADEIFVIREGKLVERGTHQRLMHDATSLYHQLYSKQFTTS
jgi:ATP-binding cassette, subfamily B, putative efflux pump